MRLLLFLSILPAIRRGFAASDASGSICKFQIITVQDCVWVGKDKGNQYVTSVKLSNVTGPNDQIWPGEGIQHTHMFFGSPVQVGETSRDAIQTFKSGNQQGKQLKVTYHQDRTEDGMLRFSYESSCEWNEPNWENKGEKSCDMNAYCDRGPWSSDLPPTCEREDALERVSFQLCRSEVVLIFPDTFKYLPVPTLKTCFRCA